MKKTIFVAFTAAMMLTSINANAQLSFGGGFTSMSFGGADAASTITSNSLRPMSEMKLPGFYFGVNYDIAFSTLEGLTLEPGLYFEHYGKDFDAATNSSITSRTATSQKHKANYFKIPINIKYSYEIAPDFKVSAFTGPRFNIGFGSINLKAFNKGGLGVKAFDAAWGLGAAFTYADAVQLRLGYDWGFGKQLYGSTDLNEKLSSQKVRRREFHIGVAFLFSELFGTRFNTRF